jgi:hypothetical protein
LLVLEEQVILEILHLHLVEELHQETHHLLKLYQVQAAVAVELELILLVVEIQAVAVVEVEL